MRYFVPIAAGLILGAALAGSAHADGCAEHRRAVAAQTLASDLLGKTEDREAAFVLFLRARQAVSEAERSVAANLKNKVASEAIASLVALTDAFLDATLAIANWATHTAGPGPQGLAQELLPASLAIANARAMAFDHACR